MSDHAERIRVVVQKLTEAIWNLDQLEPLGPDLKEQYECIRIARERIVTLAKR
jgi:hypothetical protein